MQNNQSGQQYEGNWKPPYNNQSNLYNDNDNFPKGSQHKPNPHQNKNQNSGD